MKTLINAIIINDHVLRVMSVGGLQLAEDLTKDFLLEGWLSKMGPKNEPFKRRWFTLDRRKLMYFEEPLVSCTAVPFFLHLHESHVCSCTLIF